MNTARRPKIIIYDNFIKKYNSRYSQPKKTLSRFLKYRLVHKQRTRKITFYSFVLKTFTTDDVSIATNTTHVPNNLYI